MDEELTPEQSKFAAQCVYEWIGLLDAPPTAADAIHSSLLRRMMAGKKPLDKPPPVRFGYPDYDLGEGSPVEVANVMEHGGRVVIDQDGLWEWHDKDSGILRRITSGDLYKLDGQILQKVSS